MIKPFHYQEDYKYTKGWDAFAMDYVDLLQADTVYELTKKVMYAILEKHIDLKPNMRVLDIGCGTGNDFPYFLSKGCHISGIDYSGGMLNKAYEKYMGPIQHQQIQLFHGDLNALTSQSFPTASFDLIYAITGALAYVDKDNLAHIFKQLKQYLKPGGKIITAHFSRFCLAECLYFLAQLKPRRAFVRLRKQFNVPIKQDYYTMHLRKLSEIEQILSQDFRIESSYPLLFHTPPYQTKYTPSKTKLEKYYQKEIQSLHKTWRANFADQFVVVGEM